MQADIEYKYRTEKDVHTVEQVEGIYVPKQQVAEIQAQIDYQEQLIKNQQLLQQENKKRNESVYTEFQTASKQQLDVSKQQLDVKRQQSIDNIIQQVLDIINLKEQQKIIINVDQQVTQLLQQMRTQIEQQQQQLQQQQPKFDSNTIKQQIKNVRTTSLTKEWEWSQRLRQYCVHSNDQFKNYQFAKLVKPILEQKRTMHRDDEYLLELCTNGSTFAAQFIAAWNGGELQDSGQVGSFKKKERLQCVLSHQVQLSITENNTVLTFAFTNDRWKYAKGQSVDEQYGSTLQTKLLNGVVDNVNVVYSTSQGWDSSNREFNAEKFSDAAIQPEVYLEERIREWTLCYQAVQQISNKELIAYKIVNEMGEEYGEVRIFKLLMKCLQEMLRVFYVKEIEEMLKGERFQMEVLIKKPHCWILESIFKMLKAVNEYENYVTQENIAKLVLSPEQQKQQVEKRLVEYQQSQEFLNRKQQLINQAEQQKQQQQAQFINNINQKYQLNFNAQTPLDEVVKQFPDRLREKINNDYQHEIQQLEQNYQNQMQQKQNQLSQGLNDNSQQLKSIQELKQKVVEMSRVQKKIDMLQYQNVVSKMYGKDLKMNKSQEQFKDGTLFQIQDGVADKSKVAFSSVFYDNKMDDKLSSSGQFNSYFDARVYMDQLMQEEQKLINSDGEKISVMIGQTQFTTIQQLFDHLICQYATVVLTIPATSILSPFSKDNIMPLYTGWMDITVLGYDQTTVTIMASNPQNTSFKNLDFSQKKKPGYFIEPDESEQNQVPTLAQNQVKVTNLNSKSLSDRQVETMNFSKDCSVDDVIFQMCQEKEFKKRDILCVTESNPDKWLSMYEKARIGFQHVAFNILKKHEEELCRTFPLYQKYAIIRIGQSVVIVVGDDVSSYQYTNKNGAIQIKQALMESSYVDEYMMNEVKRDSNGVRSKIQRISQKLNSVKQEGGKSEYHVQLDIIKQGEEQKQPIILEEVERIVDQIVNEKDQVNQRQKEVNKALAYELNSVVEKMKKYVKDE